MIKLLDRKITANKLSDELVAAGLPITTISRLSREVDDNGKVVLESGKPKQVAPYLLIKGDFTADEERAVKAMVDTHVADPEPTETEVAEERKEAQLNDPAVAGIIRVMAQRMGVTPAQIKEEIKGVMA